MQDYITKLHTAADYIREHAVTYDQAGAAVQGRLVALSTCADIDTNGRLVLFCMATPSAAVIGGDDDEAEPAAVRRRAVGHGSRSDSWALLNLACALLTLYTLLPLGNLRVKYRQIGYSRRMARELGRVDGAARQRRVIRDLRRFLGKLRLGLALEIAVVAGAGYLFYRTEDVRRSMVILDRWTPWMIGLFALALLVDFICFRYRGMRPDDSAPAGDGGQSGDSAGESGE